MTPNRRTLPYGKFYGTHEIGREIPGFSLALMTPILPPEDVPLHTHEQASFVLILGGAYLSSAANAGSECGAPTLIYNPPLTTHRDRFKSLAGRFLTISVSRESFRSALDYAALPLTAAAFTSREILGPARRLAGECGQWEQSSPLLAEAICLELLGLIAYPPTPQPGTAPMWLKSAKELCMTGAPTLFGLPEPRNRLEFIQCILRGVSGTFFDARPENISRGADWRKLYPCYGRRTCRWLRQRCKLVFSIKVTLPEHSSDIMVLRLAHTRECSIRRTFKITSRVKFVQEPAAQRARYFAQG